MADTTRRNFLKAIPFIGAGFLAACSKEEPEKPLTAAQKITAAKEARQELYSVVSDYHTLRHHMPDADNFPIILTKDMLDPKDISPGLVIIDPNNPEMEKLLVLKDAIGSMGGYFGRMNWDLENPGKDPAFSNEEIEAVGDENIKKGTVLERNFNTMLKKAEQAGIISQRPSRNNNPALEK